MTQHNLEESLLAGKGKTNYPLEVRKSSRESCLKRAIRKTE